MRKLALPVPFLALAVVLGSVSLPAYSVAPGPARNVVPRIDVSGHPVYRPAGRLVLTSVLVERVTVFEALGAWLDPAREVVSEGAILAPGETEEEGARRSISEMDQSVIDAVYVVLSEVTPYPREHGEGVLVEGVAAGCPAEGALFPGDVIRSVDGTAVRDTDHFSSLLDAAPPGRSLRFVVEVDGETERVSLARRPCAGSAQPLVGVSVLEAFPFPVTVSSAGIGGPSAGLMWALGLYDLLTPGDLTGGRTVAGTGDIDLQGRVGPIGGIEQKVLGAERAGADLFLVPEGNLAQARRVAEAIRLVPVATVEEAIAYLEGLPG